MQQPYIRNSRQRQYQGLLKHSNNASQNNSRWINYNIEKQTFDNADFGMPNASLNSLAHPVLNSWEDQNQNLWGFHIQANSFQIIGMEKEQFGFFPKPQNSTDNWHGYPIMPLTFPHSLLQPSLSHTAYSSLS